VRDALVLKQQCANFYETFRQTATARAAALLLPTWLSHAELTASQVDSACAAVASAGTWDEIVLHGGASHTGDFICIDGFRLQAAGYGRRDVGEITCAHTRSSFLATSYAVLGWEPSVHVQAWARRRSATDNLNGTPAGPAAAAGGGDDAASEDDEIPTLCDLDESAAATDDDEQLPPVPVTILTGV